MEYPPSIYHNLALVSLPVGERIHPMEERRTNGGSIADMKEREHGRISTAV